MMMMMTIVVCACRCMRVHSMRCAIRMHDALPVAMVHIMEERHIIWGDGNLHTTIQRIKLSLASISWVKE